MLKSEIEEEDYRGAKRIINKLKRYIDHKHFDNIIEILEKEKDNTVKINNLEKINTADGNEYSPVISADNNTLFFCY